MDFSGSTASGPRKSKRAALPRPPVGYYPHDERALESNNQGGQGEWRVKGGARHYVGWEAGMLGCWEEGETKN